MRRIEITCPQCHQLNVRYRGWAALLNPRQPQQCTLCQAELATGRRNTIDKVSGVLVWASVYLLHIFVGAGLLIVAVGLLWPGISDQPLYVRVAPMLCGALAGLCLAEHSRRAGTLLSRPQARQGGPRR